MPVAKVQKFHVIKAEKDIDLTIFRSIDKEIEVHKTDKRCPTHKEIVEKLFFFEIKIKYS